jgi:hypothetical protein
VIWVRLLLLALVAGASMPSIGVVAPGLGRIDAGQLAQADRGGEVRDLSELFETALIRAAHASQLPSGPHLFVPEGALLSEGYLPPPFRPPMAT